MELSSSSPPGDTRSPAKTTRKSDFPAKPTWRSGSARFLDAHGSSTAHLIGRIEEMDREHVNRREFLGVSIAAGAFGLLGAVPVRPDEAKPRYRVAACDWMLLKRQKLGAFPL